MSLSPIHRSGGVSPPVARRPIVTAALTGLLTLACGGVGSGDAERMLRERVGPGEPVYFDTYVGGYSATDRIKEMVRLELIEYVEGDFFRDRKGKVTVTAVGALLGIELAEQDYLRGKLCEVAFDSITHLGKPSADSVRVVVVDYVLRHAAFTPLLERLRESTLIDRETCDSAKTYGQQAQFVHVAGGWRLNNPPVIPDSGTRTTVQYKYDDSGRRTGAENEMSIPVPTDADGDSVTITWSGEVYDGKGLVLMNALKPAGVTATFPGMSGAVVYAIARDRFGGVDSARFCFQSRQFSC